MGRKKKQRPFDGIIFDIDNVLIDTRESYLEAIRWTVEIYLTEGKIPLFEPVPKKTQPFLLTPENVQRFKLLGGFNDDWDCCYGLLIYLLKLPFKSRTIKELKSLIDLEAFAKKVEKFQSRPSRPARVDSVVKMLGRPPFVKIEKISRMFQEIYLGPELFKRTERMEPLYWQKKGLIFKEKSVFKAHHLRKLKRLGLKIGITTGRPHFEAVFALRRFGLLDYIDAMTTMNEVKKAEAAERKSLRKPHPYSLIQTVKKMGHGLRLLYVGDLPDDIITAKRARAETGIFSAGLVALAQDRELMTEQMKKHGPDYILTEPADLIRLVV